MTSLSSAARPSVARSFDVLPRLTLFPRLALAALCAAIALAPSGASAELTDDQIKDRLERLEKLAGALEKVAVDRSSGSPSKEVDGRIYRRASEMHLKFLTAVSGLKDKNVDGQVLFIVQVSGFTNVVDPRPDVKPVNKVGSDFQEVTVVIEGLADKERKEKPKAKINLPTLNHGSEFDATQIARDEIQRLLEEFLPEAEIDGIKKLYENRVVIENKGPEPITVWLRYGRYEGPPSRSEVVWTPTSEPLKFRVAPKSKHVAADFRDDAERETPIRAKAIRVWAESESGERWDDHRTEPIELVAPNPKFGNSRCYHAKELATHTHSFSPSTGPRKFTERVVEFKNATSDALRVKLRYRVQSGDSFQWRATDFILGDGATLAVRDDEGMRVRASKIHFTAESDDRRYSRFSDEALPLVAESPAGRVYEAEKIGRFLYTFLPNAGGGPSQVGVASSDRVSIMNGKTLVRTVPKGASLQVLETKSGWTKVRDASGTEPVEGWVKATDLTLRADVPKVDPPESLGRVKVGAGGAELQIGRDVIARLGSGATYKVLARNESWARIEARVNGEIRHGWVNINNGVSLIAE